MKQLSSLAVLLVLGACSVSGPVTGQTVDGAVWSGSYYADLNEGTFKMGDGSTECAGTYDQMSTAKRLEVFFNCDDGRSGSAKIVRTADLKGGTGSILFSDGLHGTISFEPTS